MTDMSVRTLARMTMMPALRDSSSLMPPRPSGPSPQSQEVRPRKLRQPKFMSPSAA